MGNRNKKKESDAILNGVNDVDHEEVRDRILKYQKFKKDLSILDKESSTYEEVSAMAEAELYFIINSIIRFIRLIANRFYNHYFRDFRDEGMSAIQYSDVENAGILGAIRAIDKFDPTYNTKLLTYAKPHILASLQALRNSAYEVPAYAFSSPEGNTSPAFMEWGHWIRQGGHTSFSEVGEAVVETLHSESDEEERTLISIDANEVMYWLQEFLAAFPIMSEYPDKYSAAIRKARLFIYSQSNLNRDGQIVWAKIFETPEEYRKKLKSLKVSQSIGLRVCKSYLEAFREFLSEIGFDSPL